MNAPGIALFSILLGSALVLVTAIGLPGTASVLIGAPNSTQLSPNLHPCGTSASGLPLNCNTSAPTDLVGAGFFTLGYFLGAFTQALPLMVQGIGSLGSLGVFLFGSGIGGVLIIGLSFVIALWAWSFVANRRTDPE